MQKNIGIYIHVPFCAKKCYYCDFLSGPMQKNSAETYFTALKQEIEHSKEFYQDKIVDTIFIGGGTPSVVDPKYIVHTMECLFKGYNIQKEAEITIEANPGNVNRLKLESYRNAGINRISMGLQAAQNEHLKRLGRIHTKEQFLESFYLARDCGFDNINVDLMFGLPKQTLDDWIESVTFVSGLGPEHMACYSLIYEEGTPFYEQLHKGLLIPVEDEEDRDMFEYTPRYLAKNGYGHYEISNYAKDGRQSRHNKKYWLLDEYLGFGLGAHSYVNGKRFHNVKNLKDYEIFMYEGSLQKENVLLISKEESMSEFMILGLRMIEGVSKQTFEERYDTKIENIYGEELSMLLKKQWIEDVNGNIRLTPTGLNLANKVFVEFI